MKPLDQRKSEIYSGAHDLVLSCQIHPHLVAIQKLRDKQRDLVIDDLDWESDVPVNPMHPTILKCRQIEDHIKALMRQVLTIADFLHQKGEA